MVVVRPFSYKVNCDSGIVYTKLGLIPKKYKHLFPKFKRLEAKEQRWTLQKAFSCVPVRSVHYYYIHYQ